MAWTPDDLARLGDPVEVRLSALRPDGTSATAVPVWLVRVDDGLFLRSWKGTGGAWYRHAVVTGRARIESDGRSDDVRLVPDGTHDAAVDAAYLSTYADSPYARAMVDPPAAGTTMRVEHA